MAEVTLKYLSRLSKDEQEHHRRINDVKACNLCGLTLAGSEYLIGDQINKFSTVCNMCRSRAPCDTCGKRFLRAVDPNIILTSCYNCRLRKFLNSPYDTCEDCVFSTTTPRHLLSLCNKCKNSN